MFLPVSAAALAIVQPADERDYDLRCAAGKIRCQTEFMYIASDCGSYKACVDKQVVVRSCGKDRVFNKEAKICVPKDPLNPCVNIIN